MVFGALESPLGNAPTIFAKIWAVKALIPSILILAALSPMLSLLWTSRSWKAVSCAFALLLLLTLYGLSENVPLMAYYQESIELKQVDVQKFTTEFSPFYREHYVFPDSVKIAAPAKKRNLLFIFLESMETSFQDSANGGFQEENFIPELTELAKRTLNFSGGQLVGGGLDMVGGGWTVAGTIGKFMGVPLLERIPRYEEAELDDPTFKPHAIGLTDILARQGYNQSYVIGSQAEFHNRHQLFKVHGNVTIKDYEHYKRLGKIPEAYLVNWGFEDSKLFEFLKEELDSVSRLPEPFAVYTLTTSTHQPAGFFEAGACPEFAPEKPTEEETFKAALRCSSKQVGRFVAWAQRQKWFKNTTIVLVGDHLWPRELLVPAGHEIEVKAFWGRKGKAKPTDPYRRWLCVYVNPASEPATRFRQFSSFDIFPTTLEALGFEIQGHALGFGRSLFSSEPTLLERFGEVEIDRSFGKRTPEYLYLMDDDRGCWQAKFPRTKFPN